jgi:hypothetical protein
MNIALIRPGKADEDVKALNLMIGSIQVTTFDGDIYVLQPGDSIEIDHD